MGVLSKFFKRHRIEAHNGDADFGTLTYTVEGVEKTSYGLRKLHTNRWGRFIPENTAFVSLEKPEGEHIPFENVVSFAPSTNSGGGGNSGGGSTPIEFPKPLVLENPRNYNLEEGGYVDISQFTSFTVSVEGKASLNLNGSDVPIGGEKTNILSIPLGNYKDVTANLFCEKGGATITVFGKIQTVMRGTI